MPKTKILMYRELDGTVPLLDWLDRQPKAAREKCIAVIGLLADYGNQLRRPVCDCLRDGIFELRMRSGRVNYRVLYGFVGQNIVLLSHGCTKEKEVPKLEIERAIKNLKTYKKNPNAHSGQGS